ncbi:MAG TPA: hypothetical protein VMH90_06090, partial [Thermoplasmata archaeon]|nr:hypothetical protein [Thermoplasmata archaeon]
SYTGPVASTTITPTAPLVEIAEFEAASPTGAAVGPGTGGLSDASGLEVGLGLLVVLAVAGLLLGRRAGSASPLRPAETGLRPADESIYSSSTPRPPPEGNVPEWSEQGTPDWSEDPPARP